MHQVYADRAQATYAAMQQAFYVSRQTGLYRETAPAEGTNRFAYVWPHSRALVGTLAFAGIPGVEERASVKDRIDALGWYWDGRAYASYVLPPYGSGGDRYSDDNTWIALALLQAQRMGFSSPLKRAQQVFSYLTSNWDSTSGGLFWVEQGRGFGVHNHDRGAGATAGTAMLGFHLGEQTTGKRMLDWVTENLDASDSGSGPFYNAAREDGSVDTNVWSYNQGVMLGARILHYQISSEIQSLRRAESIAHQTLETFGDFTGQPPSFNAMCFQNLLMLYSNAQLRERILHVMRRYADWTWDPTTGAREPQSNLFSFTDAGAPNHGHQAARLQDQGAMLQLYSLLAWDPADYARLT
jgi:glycosyl hydrolase family 76